MKLFLLILSNPVLFLKKIANRLLSFYKLYILKDEFTIERTRWFKDRGDEILRLDYPELNDNSVVFDLGGYRGDFAQAINDKYGCTVYLFEPHPKFYKACVRRFISNDKIVPFNYGLSDKNGRFILSDCDDGSSFINLKHQKTAGIECEVKEIFETLDKLGVSGIDLMKINIEGGEYPILLHMISEEKISLVNNYQIQFHNFIDDAEVLRNKITDAFTKTHKRTWCYLFVWENWIKK
jgi:FkbM family methyltransferase